ncbi:hypothetical protein RFN28_09915 [Mesorhizobium sp. VK24D]|uniref:Uncharacterized protein n=1 Tax=Mesorhizobium album TaxID=3072314 RepID=A0ABU4XYQ2_9HYPH|nr:hypothetical protein [Mesorhizobium sp. VK24D]MDX8478792.1 hypothetical protein [Mesorhizobium sp. VK24D]
MAFKLMSPAFDNGTLIPGKEVAVPHYELRHICASDREPAATKASGYTARLAAGCIADMCRKQRLIGSPHALFLLAGTGSLVSNINIVRRNKMLHCR